MKQLNSDLEQFKKNIGGNMIKRPLNNGKKVFFVYNSQIQDRLIEYGELVKLKQAEKKIEKIKVYLY